MSRLPVRTSHIRAALVAAAELAQACEDLDEEARTSGFAERPQLQVLDDDGKPMFVAIDVALERAANLAAHAGRELEDEELRYRHGWRVV